MRRTEVGSLHQFLHELVEVLNIVIVGGFPDDVRELELAGFLGEKRNADFKLRLGDGARGGGRVGGRDGDGGSEDVEVRMRDGVRGC